MSCTLDYFNFQSDIEHAWASTYNIKTHCFIFYKTHKNGLFRSRNSFSIILYGMKVWINVSKWIYSSFWIFSWCLWLSQVVSLTSKVRDMNLSEFWHIHQVLFSNVTYIFWGNPNFNNLFIENIMLHWFIFVALWNISL